MSAAYEAQLNSIIPSPKTLERGNGGMMLPRTFCVKHQPFALAASTLCACVKTLFDCELESSDSGIVFALDESIPKSGYALDSRGGNIVLSASCEEGIYYATATLVQMIAEESGELFVAKAYINDTPDRDYRTLMVDLARYWHAAELVFKYIDICFMLKIKYLHLHFIDDQKYTLPSKVLPKLADCGPHYSYEEVEAFRAYANARGVIIVPEFEAPGHASILIRAYPEIFEIRRCDDADATLVTESGAVITAKDIICAGSKEANDTIAALIAEICEMFPETPYIHIGGDEANIRAWNSCRECKSYMEEHGIEDVYELYSEFVGRVARMVFDNGKTPIVWEGFPQKGVEYIPKETIVIAWESYYHLAPDLLKNGFKIINGAWKPLYIVPKFQDLWGVKNILDWNIFNWQHFWEKSPATLNPINIEPTDRVLGAQISSWEAPYDREIDNIVERLPALSERVWNVENAPEYEEFTARLQNILPYVKKMIGRN